MLCALSDNSLLLAKTKSFKNVATYNGKYIVVVVIV